MGNDSAPQASGEIQRWNGTLGSIWTKRQDDFDAVLAPTGRAVIERAAVKPGERVIDVGCGCGTTTIELASLVGSAGEVLGVDVSEPMLALATSRTGAIKTIRLMEADAQEFSFPKAHFDLVFSRVGVMFFSNPERAFGNLRSALRPGGRLAFLCFRTPAESPYLMVPLAAAHKHVPPLPPASPDAPGMFSFANEQRVLRILDAAGFRAARMEPLDLQLDVGVGRGLDAAVSILMELGPTGNVMMGKPDDVKKQVAASIRTALAPHERGPTVSLAAGMWIVTAVNP